jgi:hypothetical protein
VGHGISHLLAANTNSTDFSLLMLGSLVMHSTTRTGPFTYMKLVSNTPRQRWEATKGETCSGRETDVL